jgi:uncharacterized protein YutE (UPF0331/DUF86 family)
MQSVYTIYIIVVIISIFLLKVFRKSESPVEKIISNKYNNKIKFGFTELSKLNEEYRMITKNLKFWCFKSDDSKFITYLRFIKFYEFIIKRMALMVNTRLNNSPIDLRGAIEIIKSSGMLDDQEFSAVDQQRQFRNLFMHDLGLNYDIQRIKPSIQRGLVQLNLIMLKIIRK